MGICNSKEPSEDMNLIFIQIIKANYRQAKKLLDQQRKFYEKKQKTVNSYNSIQAIIDMFQASSKIIRQEKQMAHNFQQKNSNANVNANLNNQYQYQKTEQRLKEIYKNIQNILLTYKSFMQTKKNRGQQKQIVNKNSQSSNLEVSRLQSQIDRERLLREKCQQMINKFPEHEDYSINELKSQVTEMMKKDYAKFYELTKAFINQYKIYESQVKRLRQVQVKLKKSQDQFKKQKSQISPQRSPSQIEMQKNLSYANNNENNKITKQEYDKLKTQYEKSLENIRKEMQQLQKQKKLLQINFQRKDQKCNNLMIQVEGLIQNTYKLQTQNRKIQTQYKELLKDNQIAKNQNGNLQKKIVQIEENHNKKQQQMNLSFSILQQQKQKVIQNIQNQKKQLQNLYKQTQADFFQYKKNAQLKEEPQQSRQTVTDNEDQEQKQILRCFAFFQDDILVKRPHQKKWMIQQIQNLKQIRIKRTKLIYRLDQLSSVNFHHYIDGRPNVLLLIQLVNGVILAGFTTVPFIKLQTNKNYSGQGLIMSLTNQEAFKLRTDGQKVRPITYDEYYLIYGNSEIRLRFKDQLLFSNFGIMNAYYDPRGKKVEVLLNYGKERQIALANYEIYQVFF